MTKREQWEAQINEIMRHAFDLERQLAVANVALASLRELVEKDKMESAN